MRPRLGRRSPGLAASPFMPWGRSVATNWRSGRQSPAHASMPAWAKSLAKAQRARGPRRPLRTRACLAASWPCAGLLPEAAVAALAMAEAWSTPWIRPRSVILVPVRPPIRAPPSTPSLSPWVPPRFPEVRSPEATHPTHGLAQVWARDRRQHRFPKTPARKDPTRPKSLLEKA